MQVGYKLYIDCVNFNLENDESLRVIAVDFKCYWPYGFYG